MNQKLRKNNHLSIVLAFVCLFFLSCEFDSDDDNFKNTPLPDQTEVSLEIEGMTSEVLTISGPTTLAYRIHTSGKEIVKYDFQLDGVHFSYSDSEIHIDPQSYDGTTRIMKATIIVRMGTGDIADATDSYGVVFDIPVRFVEPTENSNE